MILLLLLTACSSTFGDEAEGGVWLGDAPTQPMPETDEPRAPEIGFLDPRNGDLFDKDDPIRVEILAGDMDGASLEAVALVWDGPITEAPPAVPGLDGLADFTLDPLPLGDYTITVTATDPDGLVTTASVSFSVVERDADGDGFETEGLGGQDCDDHDATVNPSGVEVCDGIDNDCDGTIDDGVLLPYWADVDGDSYGDINAEITDCSAPPGYVENTDDCDDTEADRWPGNPEVCDGLDNDCNEVIDEDVKDPFWGDADGDGYGDENTPTEACSAPSGYVANAEDCLDTDAAVSPAETEVCHDGLDNDCDGTSNGCGLGGTADLSTANAQLRGDASNDYAGTAVAAAGDINGDGLGDLLIGAFGSDDGGSGSGAVYLVPGTTTGVNDLASVMTAKVYGAAAGDGFGYGVAGLGDWDGDGVDDVAVGAWANDSGGTDAGAAYILSGGLAGSVAVSSGAMLTLNGAAAGDYAGWTVSGGGDPTGDGNNDLVVGGPWADGGGSLSGGAWLVGGPTSGTLSLSASTAIFVGESASDQAGSAVAMAGDVDGDGVDDVTIGAIGDGGGGAGAGAAYVVYGPCSGSIDLGAADLSLIGENIGDQAGYAVAGGGDENGDGYADVLVGAPYHDYGAADSGAAYVVLGGTHAGSVDLSAADAKVAGEGGDDGAGWSLANAGDMDGDGDDDVLIGAALEDGGGTSAGAAYLMYGPLAAFTSLTAADAKLTGERDSDYAGNGVASVGDADGDGNGDVLIGAPYEDYGTDSRAGSAYLVLGQGL
ncbi:hypothetical protein LBMAG42_54410 [Deltaproteobacteria bacterium]|nr:hypothetical protein LBMAG42_54410 [Deltaproteobacteria bacterium]